MCTFATQLGFHREVTVKYCMCHMLITTNRNKACQLFMLTLLLCKTLKITQHHPTICVASGLISRIEYLNSSKAKQREAATKHTTVMQIQLDIFVLCFVYLIPRICKQ